MSNNEQITDKGWVEFAKGLAVNIRASFRPMAPEMITHNDTTLPCISSVS